MRDATIYLVFEVTLNLDFVNSIPHPIIRSLFARGRSQIGEPR